MSAETHIQQPAAGARAATRPAPSVWPALALVRGVLATIVALGHLGMYLDAPPALLTVCGQLAFAAVVAFLVISGVSIAASLDREPRGFYRRRVKRLMPWYVVALAIGVLISPATPGMLLANLLFLQGLISPPLPGAGVVWSLGVEALCYLFAPLLLRRRHLPIALGALSLACFLVAPVWGRGEYSQEHYGGVAWLCLVWAFCGGFTLRRQPRAGLILLGLGAGITGIQTVPLASLLVIAVVIVALVPLRAGRLSLRIGDVSYPLYLLHTPVIWLLLDV